jgi:hypothetical protein
MFKGYAKRPFRGSTWTCTSLRQMMSGGAQLSKITTRSRGPIKTCMTVQSNAEAIHISSVRAYMLNRKTHRLRQNARFGIITDQ